MNDSSEIDELSEENKRLRRGIEGLKREKGAVEREREAIEKRLEQIKKELEEYKTRHPETVGVRNDEPYILKPPTRVANGQAPGPVTSRSSARCPVQSMQQSMLLLKAPHTVMGGI